MVGIYILFDFTAQRYTVHFRHHYIADNKIGHPAEYLVKRFFPVCTFNDMIPGGQFVRNVLPDLFIVFHNHNPTFTF